MSSVDFLLIKAHWRTGRAHT